MKLLLKLNFIFLLILVYNMLNFTCAWVVKLVDTLALGASALKSMKVRVLSQANFSHSTVSGLFSQSYF